MKTQSQKVQIKQFCAVLNDVWSKVKDWDQSDVITLASEILGRVSHTQKNKAS